MTDRFLVGPTAVGKSRIAMVLAERWPLTILSLDSMQVFRRMDIGTAKPTPEERERVPHALLDLVEPWESFSVARYLEEARRAEEEARAAGRIPLYVGGTALYLKVLVHGLFEGPSTDPEVRERLHDRAEHAGSTALHAELELVDPLAASRIHPHDLKRIIRALEVYEITGEPISRLQREWAVAPGKGARIAGIDMPRKLLHEEIAARTKALLASGWLEEVEGIEAAGGFGPQAAKAVGYAQILRYRRGELERERLEVEITTATRRFARRQMTWYRSFRQIQWSHIHRREEVIDPLAEEVARRLALG